MNRITFCLFNKQTKTTLFFKALLILMCFSVSIVSAQKSKKEKKTGLSVSGFDSYSQLKKYVKDLEKGKKLKKGELNTIKSNEEYLDLISSSEATDNSKALYQFSINKENEGTVTESLKKENGFLEPIYTIDFDIVKQEDGFSVEYYLLPDKEATRSLHTELKTVFNLVDFDKTWNSFNSKFEESASKRSKKYLKEYFDFQSDIIDTRIADQVKQAEGKLGGSFAGIKALNKDLFKNPNDKLKLKGEYRMHNSNYYKDFIEPLGENIDFVISPSANVYKIFNKLITQPKIQPNHNFELYKLEKEFIKKYRAENKVYSDYLKKQEKEDFKQYAIRQLKSDLLKLKAKHEGKTTKLTKEEIVQIENNPVLINKYIKEKDLVNTYVNKILKEFSVSAAKEWIKSEKKFREMLNLYKVAMESSSQYNFLFKSIMQDVSVEEYATLNYPLISKISILNNYKQFIKLDKKTSGSSKMGKLFNSIGKKTAFGKEIVESINELTGQFTKGISKVETPEDAEKYIETKSNQLKKDINDLYFKDRELMGKIKTYNKLHFKLLLDAKKAFKLSLGEDSETLD